MLVVYIWCIFTLSTCRGQLDYMMRGTNCVKSGDQVYVLGGEVSNNGWNPLEYVYRVQLDKLRNSQKENQVSWIKQTIQGYQPSSYLSSIALPSNSGIFYFRGEFSNIDEVALNYMNVNDQKTTRLSSGPSYMLDVISDNDLQFKLTTKVNLAINDKNQKEIVLIGGEIIGSNNKRTTEQSINIYNTEKNTWTSYPGFQLTSENFISFVYEGSVFIFGDSVDVDDIPDHHVIPYYEKKTSLILAEFNIDADRWVTRISTGDIPPSKFNYSYTQENHMVYMVGKNEGVDGKIYALNLDTKIWTVLSIPNFTGYESGCLTYYDNTLIHYFGENNLSKVQTVDISKFSSDNRPDGTNNANSSTPKKNLLAIILGTIGGLIILVAIVVAIIFLRRRRNKLTPPKLLDNFVMSDSLPNPLLENSNLLQSNSSSLESDSDLFKITELKPEDCFKSESNSKGQVDMRTMEERPKSKDF